MDVNRRVARKPPGPPRRSTRNLSQSSTVTTTTPKKVTPSKKRDKPEEPAEVKETKDDVVTSPAPAKKSKTALGVGDKLPDVVLKDEDDNDIKVVDLATQKGVVLFAYPKADTPGCTKQVCSQSAGIDVP